MAGIDLPTVHIRRDRCREQPCRSVLGCGRVAAAIWRCHNARAMPTSSLCLPCLAGAPASARWRSIPVQLVVFACVGGAFNLLYGLLYVLLREQLSAQPANALALVLSTIAGTFGHRYVTFGVRGTERTVQHQALGLALLLQS